MTGKTLSEKILSEASGTDVSPGDVVEVEPDLVMIHEVTGSFVVKEFEELEASRVWDPSRIIVFIDHSVPPAQPGRAEAHRRIREFVKRFGITNFYDSTAGICHEVMVEKGHAIPGRIILGTDSHSTSYGALGAFGTGIGSSEMAVIFATGRIWLRVPETIRLMIDGSLPVGVFSKDVMLYLAGLLGTDIAQYKSIEFSGATIDEMTIASRLVMSNMSVELGAKVGLIAPDPKTFAYLKPRTERSFSPVYADRDADYASHYRIETSNLEPQVACPHDVGNVRRVSDLTDVRIDQAVIGSCTNARLEDLEVAAKILRGRKVRSGVRMIITPSTSEVQRDALRNGLMEIFMDSGAVLLNPQCGTCVGYIGMLGEGEICITSQNRNFRGRMGSPESSLYLASAATVAASAVEGRISDPREYLK